MAIEEDLAYTSVLSALQTLEDKGYVSHEGRGPGRYRYFATVKAERAGSNALTRIKDAIFHGSAERMFAQMVSDRGALAEELERMAEAPARAAEEKTMTISWIAFGFGRWVPRGHGSLGPGWRVPDRGTPGPVGLAGALVLTVVLIGLGPLRRVSSGACP